MEYCPYRVSLHPDVEKNSQIDKFILNEAARKVANEILKKDSNPTLYKKYPMTVDIKNLKIFMTFEFHEDKVFHVVNARRASGRKSGGRAW